MDLAFENILCSLPVKIRRVLEFLPEDVKSATQEIRLRAGLPVCLTVYGRAVFIGKNSMVSEKNSDNLLVATANEINECLALLCNNSLYAHEDELRQGFISLRGGNRAGVAGFFSPNGDFAGASSINIRIARQLIGCADALAENFDGGMLIAGPPGSGKTTLLRDLVRQLSNGEKAESLRVSVIDSRGELSGGFHGISYNDLGKNTDILLTQNKAQGTQIALKTLFPNVIAFDEIGTLQELDAVRDCLNAGVSIITTAHCNASEDFANRRVIKSLLESGCIKTVAKLSKNVGERPQLIKIKELLCGSVY